MIKNKFLYEGAATAGVVVMSSKISRDYFIRIVNTKFQKPRIISCRVMVIDEFLGGRAATAGVIAIIPKTSRGNSIRNMYRKFQKPRSIGC